jgi:hypothetical protein
VKPAVPPEERHLFPNPLKKVKCGCGKGFKTRSALTQHREDSRKHKGSLDGRVSPVKQHGDEALAESSKSRTAGDEVDGLCSILEKFGIV